MTRIDLRPIGTHDVERLLAWRNDPLTRGMMKQGDPVSVEDHAAWCARRFADVPPRCWMGEVDGVPVGVVRLEDGTHVSITVAPEMRGRGYAQPLLTGLVAKARALGLSILHAEIKHANTASVSAHLGAGFTIVERDPDYVHLVYDLRAGDADASNG